jgi:predicted alpha/beta-fold hydrolase
MVGRVLRSRAASPYARRERLELEDGDFVDLDVAPPVRRANVAETVPFVVVLHGLEGSAASGYMRITCAALAERGIEAVAMNFRGCSGEPNRSLRSYHSGETGDLDEVLRHLRASRKGVHHGLIGYSLGGNVVLKYLGEIGAEVPGPAGAAAVSVPFDLRASAMALEQGAGRLYTKHFLRSMMRKAVARTRKFPGTLDERRVRGCRTLRTFDDQITAPVHGFRDADDYYARCSSDQFLSRIASPTLLIQSLDDPFVPAESLPRAEVRGNPAIRAVFSDTGGHLGFVAGRGAGHPTFWAEAAAVDFVARRIADRVGVR